MKLLDVYPRYDVHLDRGEGCYVYDREGNKYLDLYGGHAVISIGHSHVRYVDRITRQLNELGFYSNSVQLGLQEEYAKKLGKISGYADYGLFLCNSGAEANENALKLASFHTGRRKVIVFDGGFHGRTSLAVEATDNDNIIASINRSGNVVRVPFNDIEAVKRVLDHEVAAVLIEGIQGIAGIRIPDDRFLNDLQWVCHENGSVLILDEVQSGFGRTGRFFAHQFADIRPDIIVMAKGMGNGFPMGGIMVSPKIDVSHGMLGTTFGGNPLACAAGLAVVEVLKSKKLIDNAEMTGNYLMEELLAINEITEIRGRGLMVGFDLPFAATNVRKRLIYEHKILTGSSASPQTIRLLPPLIVDNMHIDQLIQSLKQVLQDEAVSVGR